MTTQDPRQADGESPLLNDLFMSQARLLFPGIPDSLLEVYVREWADSGDPRVALAAIRAAPNYDRFFAGNRRDDGSVRYSESEWLALKEGFEDALLSVNVNPDLFSHRFPELIAGNVSAAEFTSRIEAAYEAIIDAAPAVRQYYAQTYGSAFSNEAIVADFLDPDVGTAILERRISVSQIGGAAFSRGFSVDREFANRLVQEGVTQEGARDLFTDASAQLPVLNRLIQRHDDPDDEFDLEEFANAVTFGDAATRARLRQVFAAERSSFSSASTFARSDAGVGGLVDT